MSFKTEIEAIVGDIDSPDYTAQATLYLVEGVKFVTKSLMLLPSMAYRMTSSTTLNSSPTTMSTASVLQIISVTRNDGSRDRKAIQIRPEDAGDYTDTNSIYNATVYSPVYNVNGNTAAAEVLIFPHCNSSGQLGRIFYFAYATNSTDLTAITAATLNTSHFLPSNLIHAIVLKACINILTSYISNQVQDEEDTEMLQLITSQLQSLQASFQAEMTRYVDPQKATGGE